MEKVLIILSMFGCSDAGTQCDLLDSGAEIYRTRAACEQEMDSVLQDTQGVPYPTIIANCGTPEETALIVNDLAPGASNGSAMASNQTVSRPNS